jgi:hypothetical protein
MPVGRWSISATLTFSYQFTTQNLNLLQNMEYFFCNNSFNSGKIFTLKKKILRIMAGAQPRTSCRSILKQLEILPFPSHSIISLMNFFVNNQEKFQTNSSILNFNTRNKHHLHRPNNNRSYFQKRTFYAGVNIFNNLPPSLTILKNDQVKFRTALRKQFKIPRLFCG